ncbi:GNAT family N-acetyltransferase [Terrabacter sp. NPDC000476]|uniref:GNAT family N-acetyltransferase n=1 Tax=Terrabacter sp. NPDC000476 TaxID=3154258 RepID=UPI003319C6B5
MSESDWQLRPLVAEDCDELARVHMAVWREAYADVMPADYLAGLSDERCAAGWRRRVDAAGEARTLVVVGPDGGIAGFASAGPSRDDDAPTQWELHAINLTAAARGTGVADRLLDELLGDRESSLWVVEANARAVAFYARRGFVDEGGRAEHDPTGTVEMRMVRLTPQAPSAGTVRAEGLGVRFGDVVALDGVTVEAAPGGVLAVTGPSGAGKSTLLWALAGALADTATCAGRVTVGEAEVSPRAARDATVRLGVAVVPQGNGLASVLTASENCLVPLVAAGLPAREARDRVEQALLAVGLEDSGNHLIEELSGGQQQRVAVARALASQPLVLLADEPTSELDHANRERVLALLHDLAATGRTVVMATHDPEAAATARHEVHLDEGRVVRRR